MIDTALLNAQCIHAVKLALECVLAAGFLTFCWLIAPYIRGTR
jgi:hypothetical protein